MRTGIIYCAEFPNGKRYIGQTRQKLARRVSHHKSHNGDNAINRAIAKYGEPKWFVLATVKVELLDNFERFYIRNLRTMSPHGYNLTAGGESGKEVSDETRARMSASLRGRVITPEHAAKIGAANRGRKHNAEYSAMISARHLGRKHSAETRAKMSAAQKRRREREKWTRI